MRNSSAARTQFVLTMMIFGTIGTISRFVQLPSSMMACVRSFIGVLVIALYLFARKKKPDYAAIRRNAGPLFLLGIMLGINWVVQFEAFRYTTVATATLCYYMQPIFVILAAPFAFHERLSPKKIACVVAAFTGMVLVSGVLEVGVNLSELRGVIYALIGALLYAAIIIVYKRLDSIDAIDGTACQLLLAGLITFPYMLATENLSALNYTVRGVALLILLGVFHTGFAYIVYYDALAKLEAQTASILSYIDPVEAVLLSALVLREGMTAAVAIGAVLILGATMISELSFSKKPPREISE